jgi:uncharacterized peroxidase-related enzyme
MSTATQTPTSGISPLTKEQASPDVQPIFDKLTHVVGHMPGFFGTMARVPEALTHFLSLYAAIIDKGSVEAKYKELAYLKTAQINGCEYCFRAHSASGKKHGVTEQQIGGLAFFARNPAFDKKEKAVLLYAERVTRGASAMREGSVAELKQHFTDDQIVELTLTICIANFTNRFNDAFTITPDLG